MDSDPFPSHNPVMWRLEGDKGDGPCPEFRWFGVTVTRELLTSLLALAACLSSCAGPNSEIHLPPFYSSLSRAGGGQEVEALAGVVRLRRRLRDPSQGPLDPWDQWMLRPLFSHTNIDGERWTRFLVPLGLDRSAEDEHLQRLLPLYWFNRDKRTEEGSWRFLSATGIVAGRRQDGRRSLAWFPIAGRIHDFLTWDRITFFLFPLWARTERGEDKGGEHIFWPLFHKGEGVSTKTLRVLPFYSESIREGVWEKRSYLWPFFHTQWEQAQGSDVVTRRFWFFPFYGRIEHGSYRSTAVLWPLFGWSSNPETGFWAWDGPWPIIRWQGGDQSLEGQDAPAEVRKRVWPLWSIYRGDGIETEWFLWPIINRFRESNEESLGGPASERRGLSVFPFWQRWESHAKVNSGNSDTTADLGEGAEDRDAWREGELLRNWTKAWPLYQDRQTRDYRRRSIPALNPLPPTPVVDEHYAFLYELFTVESDLGWESRRAWGNLYRRESDAGETRSYLLGLWSNRRYRQADTQVKETSLLFGLLRWRSKSNSGRTWMRPAFPGPGWPLERQQAKNHQLPSPPNSVDPSIPIDAPQS